MVYGITEMKGSVWFLLFNSSVIQFPIFYPAMFFEIIDPRLSRFWVYSFDKEDLFPFLITFKEWALNRDFFCRLSTDYFEDEEYLEERDLFQRYRQAMDLEFPDQAITQSAQIADDSWLICPKCIDAWEYPDNQDALVICPSCVQKYNNPRYKNDLSEPVNLNIGFFC